MSNIIKPLPSWVLVNRFPAFYESESLTSVEQTSRVYAKMNELIESYNKYVEQVNAELVELETKHDADYSCTVNTIIKLTSDYMGMVDLKLTRMDRKLAENYKAFTDNVLETIQQMIDEMKANGELDAALLDAVDDLNTKFNEIRTEYDAVYREFTNIQTEWDEMKTGVTAQMDEIKSDYEETKAAMQEDIHFTSKESLLYPDCFYRTSKRGFTEWINAPMLAGVEYLTNERHNGEPVWVKLVELGSLPCATVTTAEDGTTTVTPTQKNMYEVIPNGNIFWYDAWISKKANSYKNESGETKYYVANTVQKVPIIKESNQFKVHVFENATYKNNIQITSYNSVDYGSYTAHALIKFTRPRVYAAPVNGEWERAMLDRIDMSMVHTVALKDVPKADSTNLNAVTQAGDVLTGVNYSSVYKENSTAEYVSAKNRLVGTCTPLSTYYSALENPVSVMYTSGDVDPSENAWSSYYGMDCSGFVSYVLGLGRWVWTLAMTGVETQNGKNVFDEFHGQVIMDGDTGDINSVQRGDMIINTLHGNLGGKHVKVVKDVLYTSDGELYGFYVAESVKPYVTVTFMTPAEFSAQLTESVPYSVIRYDASLFNTDVEPIKYSKSVYPDRGDGGKYTKGESVKLYTPVRPASNFIVDGTIVPTGDPVVVDGYPGAVYTCGLQLDEGEHTIACDNAPDDPCTVIIEA